MAKKIEGYSSKNAGKGALRGGAKIEFQSPEYAERHGMKAATLVIHEGKLERVFTESEVMAMLKLSAASMDFPCDKILADHAKRSLGIVLDPA